ncbi:hypothetical protein V8G54_029848 [Vigna mungo]|uniref:Uncharacterized protein n=1 Tax=Vigna mungo TaxID=3915 RepID=A0AAQ3MUJ4_VIGMU
MCKLNCPPFSLTSIFVPSGALSSKFDTIFAITSPSIGNASMIPGQLLLPTPNGTNLKSTFPPATASVVHSSSKNLSGLNSSGFFHHDGLFASHQAFTTTLDSFGIVYPPNFASSRFMWGTKRGIGV